MTSVPSRTHSAPPKSHEILHLFEEKMKKTKINTDKNKKYSRNFSNASDNRKESTECDTSIGKKDLKFYLSNLPPPCRSCMEAGKRLGVEITWTNCATDNDNIVIASGPISCNGMNGEDFSPSSDYRVPRKLLYGLDRCRQVLQRNAHLLPR